MERKRRCPRCGCELGIKTKCPRCGASAVSTGMGQTVDDRAREFVINALSNGGSDRVRVVEHTATPDKPTLNSKDKKALKIIGIILASIGIFWLVVVASICIMVGIVFSQVDWSEVESDDYYYEYHVDNLDDYPMIDEFKGSDYY